MSLPHVPKLTGLEKVVIGLWVIFLMDPQFLACVLRWSGGHTRADAVLLHRRDRSAVGRAAQRDNGPLRSSTLTGYVALTTPFAVDKMQSFGVLKMLVIIWLLAMGTLVIFKTPKRAIILITVLMLWQYLWWAVMGIRDGLVPWDYLNANYDGYGPLMAGGIAAGAFYGLALKKGKVKWLAYLVGGLSLVALMSSFARGAVLSGVAVIGVSWLRSPRKGVMTAAIVGGAAIVVVLSLTVFSNIDRGDAAPNFLTEMSTIVGAVGDPANDVEGTAQDRHAIWAAAMQLYQRHPIFGVGANGFGPAAAGEFRVGEIAGPYGENPGMLWGKALHNAYYQVLCELGTIGFIILLWILIDFERKNAKLRSPEYRQAWAAATGGEVDLQNLALGLEAIVVGWCVSAYFYNVLQAPWFYGTIMANLLLHQTLTQWIKDQSRGRRRAGVRSGRGPSRALVVAPPTAPVVPVAS